MPAKIYFYILILCEIWPQGIIGTFPDEDIREASNFYSRQKRVVSDVPVEDLTTSIQYARHVVIIRHNARLKCVGSILSHHVVISITPCVVSSVLSEYQIMSATLRTDRGTPHNVTDIKRKYSGIPSRTADGIALLTVDPPFVYGRTLNIPLHSGPLLQGTIGIISGWGYNFRCNDRGTRNSLFLRSIQVPIISHWECVNRYRPHNIEITEADVCTYHPQKHCGHTDGGAPLVINGQLAGIHLWTGLDREQNDPRYPDVFAILQDSTYYQWITRTMREIEAQFQNQHK